MKRIPVAITAAAVAALLGGCSAAASTTAATAPATAPQAASSKQPGCTTAVATVQQVASEAGIDLVTGASDGRTVSSDDAVQWSTQLEQAGKIANRYNTGTGPGRQLASDLLHAQAAATLMSLDIGAGKPLDADVKALVGSLQAVSYNDC
jgi:hypothetical protein